MPERIRQIETNSLNFPFRQTKQCMTKSSTIMESEKYADVTLSAELNNDQCSNRTTNEFSHKPVSSMPKSGYRITGMKAVTIKQLR